MKVAALQTDIVWEDRAANFARLEPWLARAADAGVRLVALPEMFAVGFSMATGRIAEPYDGPTVEFLRGQAAQRGLWVAGSLPELPPAGAVDPRPANSLVLAGPTGELHRYAKIHPFSYAGEDRHYRAGSERVIVEIEGLRLALFVCYDLRFADEFWACAAEADAYLVVANWPEARRRHWQSLLAARAIENQAWVIGVNRVGSGGSLSYVGDSRIVDPLGEVVAGAARQEALLCAEVDAESVARTRRDFPFLQDRRPSVSDGGGH